MKKKRRSFKKRLSLHSIQKKLYSLRHIFLIILFSIICLMLFGNIAIKIILFPASIFLGYWSTISSKFVPHITLETMSIFAIMGGLLFGSQYGFTLGLVSGLIVYILLSIMKLTTIVNSFVIGLGGYAAGVILNISPYNIKSTFMLCVVIRAIIGVIIFWKITPDKVEALAHAIIDPIFNIGIYVQVFYPLYIVLKTFI